MPWRGPDEPGEFPTLGYLIGEWIESSLIIPDGLLKGEPYLLTLEMWRHLLWSYRLRPDATPEMGNDAFVYYGAQLVRTQKWGKDPFGACLCCAHALGPTVFDGWDASGEAVGRPVPTPWVQCVATAEDQTANTFRPIVSMLGDGPLSDTPGLDVGETRIKLPAGDGWIEPVTASMKARLGARITYATLTEPHLMTERDGGVALAKAIKRNLAGMGGRWLEITNAWDPSEKSVAQRTHEAKRPGVFLDYRPPRTRVDLDDDEALRREVIYVYGDSARVNGGWVSEARIIEEIRAEDTGEAEARRYFLNEIVVGSHDAVDPVKWDAQGDADSHLAPGDMIALGFDGSRHRDGTALIACRIADGRLFNLGIWEPPDDESEWTVPHTEVDDRVCDVFDAYDVRLMLADPHRWQDYLALWAGRWPKRIAEFDTRHERKMDDAILAFIQAFRLGELPNDASPDLARHARNAALANGKRKPEREPGRPEFYRRVVKKKAGRLIDAFVAAILARAARAKAIEDGALEESTAEPSVYVF